MKNHRGQEFTFLDRLVSLTDERDLDMLERSVLVTAGDVLKPDVAVFYRKLSGSLPLMSMLWDGSHIVHRKEADKQYNFDSQSIEEHVALFPIQGTDDVIGYLIIEREMPVTNDEKMMIDGLLKVYHNFLSVLNDSRRDGLTGLLNRRMFDQQFQRILNEMIDGNRDMPSSNREQLTGDVTVWLAMIDIDNFKNINDTFGHLYGDEVLILIARYLTETFREHDLVFRFGGEEFVVLLQTPDKKKVVDALERFRCGIENHAFPQIGKVTASIGVVKIEDQLIPPLLVANADEALYYAKEQGKNRVIFYEDMPEEARSKPHLIDHEVEIF